jgi:hypothetical protein
MSETETDAQPADAQPAARESKRLPAAGLERMTVAELTALRDAAEAKRLEKLEDAKNAVLEETRAKLAELGLTLEAGSCPVAWCSSLDPRLVRGGQAATPGRLTRGASLRTAKLSRLI